MVFGRARGVRLGIVLTLLLTVSVLLGLSGVAHSHDAGFAPSHCDVCRWASAAPTLVVVLALLLTLPDSGPLHVPATAHRPGTWRRRTRSRGPPLS